MSLMLCKSCRRYSLESVCSKCNNKTINPSPPRYSPVDKYGSYRRQLKLKSMQEKK